ncbi:MAG: hypothetical protein GY828_04455 [Candidatus Gracilibacteria bacterium]|nr:hypothetical protein [Candidatus Gracilibacteria bacterium]
MKITRHNYITTEEKGIKTISIGDIQFIGTELVTSAIGNVYAVITGEKGVETYQFDTEREILHFFGNYFILKYTKKELRDADKAKLQSVGDFNKYGKTEKNEEGYQLPKTDFIADIDGNYYLMIKGTRALEQDFTDLNKGVFQSLIIDVNKYNLGRDKIYSKTEEANQKVLEILG